MRNGTIDLVGDALKIGWILWRAAQRCASCAVPPDSAPLVGKRPRPSPPACPPPRRYPSVKWGSCCPIPPRFCVQCRRLARSKATMRADQASAGPAQLGRNGGWSDCGSKGPGNRALRSAMIAASRPAPGSRLMGPPPAGRTAGHPSAGNAHPGMRTEYGRRVSGPWLPSGVTGGGGPEPTFFRGRWATTPATSGASAVWISGRARNSLTIS